MSLLAEDLFAVSLKIRLDARVLLIEVGHICGGGGTRESWVEMRARGEEQSREEGYGGENEEL